MTLGEVRAATLEAAAAATQLADHLDRMRERLAQLFPMSGEIITGWGDEPRERLHAFLRMFEQLYDLAARKLLRGYVLLSGEDATAMSAKSLARRAETLGALASTDAWLELGTLRNRLVHDYPLNGGRQAEVANAAWADLPALLGAVRLLIDKLEQEQLI